MSWNYRIVKYANGNGYGLHKVHYNEDGKACGMGKMPAAIVGETVEEVRETLATANEAVFLHPIFEEPEEWTK